MALRGIPKAFLPALFCFLSFGSSSTSTTRTDLALAFVPVSLSAGPSGSRAVTATKTNTHHRPSAVSLGVVSVPETAEALQEMTNARFAFWMCFYGAAGVGSIGRELIPIVFGRYQSTSSLESESTSGTAGSSSSSNTNRAQSSNDDEDLGIWGYPEKIYRRDVEMILNNPLTPLAIANKYPIENDEDADKRYQYTHMENTVPFLGYDGFAKANPRANPVALRAVFDSFSNSIGGSNAVSPITAERNIESFLLTTGRGSGGTTVSGAMAKKLNGGKTIGLTAFLFVLVLLGVGDWLAIFHLWRGWFPEWQGFSDFPSSFFDKDIGIAVLPNYFVGDVPTSN